MYIFALCLTITIQTCKNSTADRAKKCGINHDIVAGPGPRERGPVQVYRKQPVWRDQRQPLPQHRGCAHHQVPQSRDQQRPQIN